MSIQRRVRQAAKRPNRALGQRLGLRPEAADKFKDEVRQYRQARQNNRILDEMEGIAAARGQQLSDIGEANYARIEGQALAADAFRKAVPYAIGGGAAALGGAYAMGGLQGGLSNSPIGMDPLAASRNKIAEANALLGSERMLEAAALDQIDFMGEQAAASEEVAVQQFNQQVSQLVDQRAAELRQTPIMKSDGTSAPMPYDTSVRLAQEEVSMQLRAQGIL